MSFVKILIHAVWGTKSREPIMSKREREVLFDHIRENAKAKNIRLISLGGFYDHVHCLLILEKDQTIAKTIQLLKGESSNWANKRNLFTSKLIWAEDYFAASVNAESVHRVKNYIANQEQHHRSKSFGEEFELFKKVHGFESSRQVRKFHKLNKVWNLSVGFSHSVVNPRLKPGLKEKK